MKQIPSILKYMLGSLMLGVTSIVITIFLPFPDNLVTQYWLSNISYAFAVFSNGFTILAISEFIDPKIKSESDKKNEE